MRRGEAECRRHYPRGWASIDRQRRYRGHGTVDAASQQGRDREAKAGSLFCYFQLKKKKLDIATCIKTRNDVTNSSILYQHKSQYYLQENQVYSTVLGLVAMRDVVRFIQGGP